jgi:hypothetical protein
VHLQEQIGKSLGIRFPAASRAMLTLVELGIVRELGRPAPQPDFCLPYT